MIDCSKAFENFPELPAVIESTQIELNMLKKLLASSSLVIVLLTTPCLAENPLKRMYLSDDLFWLLQSNNKYLNYYTKGYVAGVAFAYDHLAVLCLEEEELDQKKLFEHVLRYYEEQPQERHELSSILIKRALKAPFPCE
jgi:hypothetical protein